MYRLLRRLIANGVLILSVTTICRAQSLDDLSNKYPDESGVITVNKQDVILSFEGDSLTARSYTTQDIMVLKSNAISRFTTGSVYESYYNMVRNIKAQTLVPDKHKYKIAKSDFSRVVPSEGESVFYDDTKETEVSFSNIVPGAVTHLEYETDYRDIHLLPRFYFKSYIPIVNNTFSLTFPDKVDIGYVLSGGADTSRIKRSVRKQNGMTTITWTAPDMPKVNIFDNAPSISYYLPHISIYVKSYTDHNGKKIPVLQDVASLYQYQYGLIKDNLNMPSPVVDTLAAELTKNAPTPGAKASAIYTWVQHNVKYIAYEDSLGGFVPRVPGTVCQRKFGDCKDMATLLRALCRSAGLDAHIVWIGTRKLPYSFEQLPTPAAFNHMIAVVKLDDKWVFMDGTDPTMNFGHIPAEIQGKEGLIELGDGKYEIAKMPVAAPMQNLYTDSTFVAIKNNTVEGNSILRLYGANASDVTGQLMYETERDKKDAIQSIMARGSNKYSQKDYDYTTNDKKEATIKANFSVPDYITAIDKEYYVNMNLSRTYGSAWTDLKDRDVPIKFSYEEAIQQVVTLTIPDGYKVTYLPKDSEWKRPGLASYKFAYHTEGAKVMLTKTITIDTLYAQAAQFDDYNSFITGLQNNYKETVVLSPQ